MEEAEAATAQLDAAFKATGATLGLSRSRLDGLASSLQLTTRFSDDLVKEGEAILLTFDKVRGQAFERTIRVAADLSSRLGTDLTQSIRQVGLALQDPIAGLTALRRSGIAPLSEAQTNLVKNFLETNQAAKAQNLILSELERRFGGSAEAARNTLGGALAGLKNSFGDLFEGSRESGRKAAEAINQISEALNDPKLKSNLDRLIEGAARVAAEFIKAAGAQAEALRQGLGIGLGDEFTRGGGPRRGGLSARAPEQEAAIETLEEINITVKKIVDANADLMQELADSTKTGVEKASGEYIKLKETLQFLHDQQLITSADVKKRLGAALDDLLPEFDLNEIRAKYISVKKATTELGEFMKGVWQEVGRSIQSTLSDAIYEWKLSWSNLLNIARRALADITSAIITSGIKNALKDLFRSNSSSGGDALSQFFGLIGGAAGAAGGGRISGATVVGEDGPELLFGRGSVMNKRQMAFAGAAASIVFAPVTNIQIIERDDPQRAKAEIFEAVQTENARSQQEFLRVLNRSGIEVKG